MASVVDFTPTALDLKLYANDDEPLVFRLWSDSAKTTPLVITGYTWKVQLRASSGGTAVYEPTPTAHNTAGGADPSTVTIPIACDDLLTALGVRSGQWDMQTTHATYGVQTWFRGTWSLSGDVTR